jgi:hypothetical protein
MAEDGDKTGSGEGPGSGSGSGGALTPYTPPAPPSMVAPAAPPVAAPWFPAPYAPPMFLPLPPAADKSEIKLSDATPAQVRNELGWLVSTAKQNRMPVGVQVACHRLLLLTLLDLEDKNGIGPSVWPWRQTAVHRLRTLQKAGAVTKAVVDEARLIRLEPDGRAPAYGALMGDPAEALRYVSFLRMLVDVAYEAQAKYRKAQQPPPKTAQGMSMSVTVGPQSGG